MVRNFFLVLRVIVKQPSVHSGGVSRGSICGCGCWRKWLVTGDKELEFLLGKVTQVSCSVKSKPSFLLWEKSAQSPAPLRPLLWALHGGRSRQPVISSGNTALPPQGGWPHRPFTKPPLFHTFCIGLLLLMTQTSKMVQTHKLGLRNIIFCRFNYLTWKYAISHVKWNKLHKPGKTV